LILLSVISLSKIKIVIDEHGLKSSGEVFFSFSKNPGREPMML
jgi:hypothetical protein